MVEHVLAGDYSNVSRLTGIVRDVADVMGTKSVSNVHNDYSPRFLITHSDEDLGELVERLLENRDGSHPVTTPRIECVTTIGSSLNTRQERFDAGEQIDISEDDPGGHWIDIVASNGADVFYRRRRSRKPEEDHPDSMEWIRIPSSGTRLDLYHFLGFDENDYPLCLVAEEAPPYSASVVRMLEKKSTLVWAISALVRRKILHKAVYNGLTWYGYPEPIRILEEDNVQKRKNKRKVIGFVEAIRENRSQP